MTGKDHWEALLRARAVENCCYVIAPAQTRRKTKSTVYGRSMIIDAWGNVLACAPDKPCVITAEINLDYVDKVRASLAVFGNRRTDVYSLADISS